jgi:DNA-binding response OmpR family regulator
MTAGPAAPVILLVDDEEGILEALRRTLGREGFELVAARSAREALRTLASRPVDLVLSDHKMPITSGLELVREIAAQWPDIPRLLITGWPAELDPAELRSLGVRAVLPKPWDAQDLRARVRACLA